MSDYTIQPYHSGNYPMLQALFKAAFNTDLPPAAFTKKYNTAALGRDVIGFVAVHTPTQTAAAFYGVFPVKALINGQEVLVAQSGDTMTHPAHQRKGLFVKLARLTFEVCRKEGVALIFGQPNRNSYQGLVNRLQFAPLDQIIRYDLKLTFKTLPVPKLALKGGWFQTYLRLAKALLKNRTVPSPNDFTNPLPTAYGKVLRNSAYLDYKDEPDKVFIRLGNALFWLKFTDVLWIGDANDYGAVTPPVLGQLKRIAFALGYNTVSFHFNQSVPPPEFLKRFQTHSSEASCFLSLSGDCDGLNLLLTGADFDTW